MGSLEISTFGCVLADAPSWFTCANGCTCAITISVHNVTTFVHACNASIFIDSMEMHFRILGAIYAESYICIFTLSIGYRIFILTSLDRVTRPSGSTVISVRPKRSTDLKIFLKILYLQRNHYKAFKGVLRECRDTEQPCT